MAQGSGLGTGRLAPYTPPQAAAAQLPNPMPPRRCRHVNTRMSAQIRHVWTGARPLVHAPGCSCQSASVTHHLKKGGYAGHGVGALGVDGCRACVRPPPSGAHPFPHRFNVEDVAVVEGADKVFVSW
jgi:hypothetical protein